jgi:hypothetical protein
VAPVHWGHINLTGDLLVAAKQTRKEGRVPATQKANRTYRGTIAASLKEKGSIHDFESRMAKLFIINTHVVTVQIDDLFFPCLYSSISRWTRLKSRRET